MTQALRLGVIGLSDGNGHPYSWSAIFNGYDQAAMESCGFPVIPRYLEKQTFPDDAIAGVQVTHVWTQDNSLSAHVARAARIQNICRRPEDMLAAVDGVLLARDDAETHFEFARPFLDAGLPIYIDKPIALSLTELDRLYSHQQYAGQIFTCSALRYASELQLDAASCDEIGPVRALHAVTPKDWNRYAVHVIEPALALLGDQGSVVASRVARTGGDGAELAVTWQSGVSANFAAMGSGVSSPLALRVMGENGWRDLVFRDTFFAFRAALGDFVAGIRAKDERAAPGFVRRVVDLIERGNAE